MSRAHPIILREQILKEWQSGKSFVKIASEHKIAYQSVQSWCHRFKKEGKAGLKPRYARCGPQAIKTDPLIYRCALWLKRLHSKWGAPLIRLKLQQRYPEKKIPGERAFQNWFRKAGLNAPRSKHPKQEKQWAKKVHEVWQVDGKEEQLIQDNKPACWLTMVDEYTGGLIAAPAFPKKESTMLPFKISNPS